MTTLHANSPRDALARLETLCLMAGLDLPALAIRRQIASALDILIQVSRQRDGSRRVTAISEVVGMEGDVIVMQDLFLLNQGARKLLPTGVVPKFLRSAESNEMSAHFIQTN